MNRGLNARKLLLLYVVIHFLRGVYILSPEKRARMSMSVELATSFGVGVCVYAGDPKTRR